MSAEIDGRHCDSSNGLYFPEWKSRVEISMTIKRFCLPTGKTDSIPVVVPLITLRYGIIDAVQTNSATLIRSSARRHRETTKPLAWVQPRVGPH